MAGPGKNFDVAANVKPLVLFPSAAVAGTANGTGIDVSGLGGRALLNLSIGTVTGTAPTLDVTFEDSLLIGGPYAAIAGSTAIAQQTAAAEVPHSLALGGTRKFVRAVATMTGTAPVFTMSLHAFGAGANTLPVSTNPAS